MRNGTSLPERQLRGGLALVLALLVTVAPGGAVRGDGGSPSLHDLMEQLLADLQVLSYDLLHADHASASAAARRIADHPMVEPGQRAAIARELGPEMAGFKAFDTRVHDAALAISELAGTGDDAAVAERFGELIGACTGCHTRFRDRVRTALEAR